MPAADDDLEAFFGRIAASSRGGDDDGMATVVSSVVPTTAQPPTPPPVNDSLWGGPGSSFGLAAPTPQPPRPEPPPQPVDDSNAGVLEWMRLYQRSAHYLSVAHLYLRDNFFAESPLVREHLRDLSGARWRGCPAFHLVYVHLNRLILQTQARVLFVAAAEFGPAAWLPNLYLEGVLGDRDPAFGSDRAGIEALLRSADPLADLAPGALALPAGLDPVAFATGAAFDAPERIVACLLAEPDVAKLGPSWQLPKFLDPETCGAVLPVVTLDPTAEPRPSAFAAMTDDELAAYFAGLGYEAQFAGGDDLDATLWEAVNAAYTLIQQVQLAAREGSPLERPTLPVVVVRLPADWLGSGIETRLRDADASRSPALPAVAARDDNEALGWLEEWLHAHQPGELFSSVGPLAEVSELCPAGELRMGQVAERLHDAPPKPLDPPPLSDCAGTLSVFGRGQNLHALPAEAGRVLRDFLAHDGNSTAARVFAPAGLMTLGMDAVYEATPRCFAWPFATHLESANRVGRVVECGDAGTALAALAGYRVGGPFAVAALRGTDATALAPVLPGFTDGVALVVDDGSPDDWMFAAQRAGKSILFPPDANTLVAALDAAFADVPTVAAIPTVALPLWLKVDEAAAHLMHGISVWPWASSFAGEAPEVVIVAVGGEATVEAVASIALMRAALPDLRVRFVNAVRLELFAELAPRRLARLVPADAWCLVTGDCPTALLYAAVGPPLCSAGVEFAALGRTAQPGHSAYRRAVHDERSRYHLAMRVVERAGDAAMFSARAEVAIRDLETRLAQHAEYATHGGGDPPEVRDWAFKAG